MFAITSALTPQQRSSAEITSGTFDDLLMGPGKLSTPSDDTTGSAD